MHSDHVAPIPVIDVVDRNMPTVVEVYLHNLGLLEKGFMAARHDSMPLDTLRVIYKLITDELPVQPRLSLLKGVVNKVRSAQLNPSCLLSIAMSEHDPDIIDVAITNFLELNQPDSQNRFAALEAISLLLEDEQVKNPGAVHAALACFGDRRVCAILKNQIIEPNRAEADGFFNAMSRPRKMKTATLDYLLCGIVKQEIGESPEGLNMLASAMAAYVFNSADHDHVYDNAFNFGSHCIPHYIAEQKHSYAEFLTGVTPLIERFQASKVPTLINLANLLQDPMSGISPEELMRKSRSSGDRRADDRRILNLMPLIEQRSRQRRTVERREDARTQAPH